MNENIIISINEKDIIYDEPKKECYDAVFEVIRHPKSKKHLITKFGNASLDESTGYYRITNGVNTGKLLHRLVFEDYHNCKLDNNDVIHHADFDKQNNHPSNLICMSIKAHNILHKTGKTRGKSKITPVNVKLTCQQLNNGKWLYVCSYVRYNKECFISSYSIDDFKKELKLHNISWDDNILYFI